MLALLTIVFGFTWWLGLYLLARNGRRSALRLAGLGIVCYALGLAGTLVNDVAGRAASPVLTRASALLLLLPTVCWAGTMLELLPGDAPMRDRLLAGWRRVVVPLVVLLLALGVASDLLLVEADGATSAGPAYFVLALGVWMPLLLAFSLVGYLFAQGRLGKQMGVLLAVLVLFLVSSALLLLPFDVFPRDLTILSVGLDLVILDLAIAILDAFDEGETLLPDITRSFVAAAIAGGLFGGQVALAVRAGVPFSAATLGLLLAVVGSAIALVTFASALAALFDRLAFAGKPSLQQARADLRTAADVLPRVDTGLDLAQLDDVELTRITRRALSHYGDLARLASNPLTQLPGLVGPEHTNDPLVRAAALKALLAHSIAHLKPRSGDDFGTSDEWRYYNALHFPYVKGLKPYSRRVNGDDLDDAGRRALEWFQSTVPERTLYNWQTAAARLVAQDLRARQLNDAT